MDKTISKTNHEFEHKNLTKSLQNNTDEIIVNLPILINEVDKVLSQSNNGKNDVKNGKKRYIAKDNLGYYIM